MANNKVNTNEFGDPVDEFGDPIVEETSGSDTQAGRDYYSPEAIAARQAPFKDKQLETALGPVGNVVNTIKKDYGPLIGSIALPLAVTAAQPEIGLPWLMALGAGGAVLGEGGQRKIEGKKVFDDPEKYASEALLGAGGELAGAAIKTVAKPVTKFITESAAKSKVIPLALGDSTAHIDPNKLLKGSRAEVEGQLDLVGKTIEDRLGWLSDNTDPSDIPEFPALDSFYGKLIKGGKLSYDELAKTNLQALKNSVLKEMEKSGHWSHSDYAIDAAGDRLEMFVRQLVDIQNGVKMADRGYARPAGITLFEKAAGPTSQYGLRLLDNKSAKAEALRDKLRGGK